jgi:transcriptional regulator of acetoin/glycerol metabolism
VSDTVGTSEDKTLAEVERRHIGRVLDESGWNVLRAARLLGIDRVTLYNKIKKYGFTRIKN